MLSPRLVRVGAVRAITQKSGEIRGHRIDGLSARRTEHRHPYRSRCRDQHDLDSLAPKFSRAVTASAVVQPVRDPEAVFSGMR